MPAVFNRLNVAVSCLGNHDLDFGIETMQSLVKKTAPTKWMITNLSVPKPGKELGSVSESVDELI